MTTRPHALLNSALFALVLLTLSACNDVVYRADDVVSGMDYTTDDADVEKLERAVAAGSEAARYDLAEYYISNGRYDDAEALGVIIETQDERPLAKP